jgi:transglutaminase-like putative cysteine protease
LSSLATAEGPSLGRRWRLDAARARRSVAPVGLELVLFASLGGFVLVQWGRLFADPPAGRLAGALVIACAIGLVLALIGHPGRSRRLTLAVAVLVGVAGTLAAMVVVGLPLRLLAPAHWSELVTNLGDGLGGIQDAHMPIDGERTWTRLALLLGAPLLLGIAATAAFWPGRRRGLGRVVGLAALLTIYGLATTLDSPGSELLWGVPVLILVGAWLWLPNAGRRGVVVLASAAVAAGLALPLAAAIDPERPWWDYEHWNLFVNEETVAFNWDHSYGPLDWPQKGTTLLEVRSDRPLYWKASVLDRFDGFAWQRADVGDPLAAAEIEARGTALLDGATLARANPEWLVEASFDIRNLESDFVVGAGTPTSIEGYGAGQRASDGTVLAGDDPLQAGDEYSVVAYSPQPRPRRMRRAPQSFPEAVAAGGTLVGLPAGPPGAGQSRFGSAPAVRVPVWGEPRDQSERRMRGSVYGDMYALARNLTAGAPTAYDAVAAIERHLRSNYDYTQSVPNRTFPLSSFLFDDVGGYCQQFSGAMALMLRMVGIPARVVSGFAPGRYVAADDLYEVSDTDAHSWVEVYFVGIGWVAFDPTPAAAPAAAQLLESGGPVALGRDASASERGRGLAADLEDTLGGDPAPAVESRDDGGAPVGGILSAALAAVALWLGAGYLRRRAGLRGTHSSEIQARELTSALESLGWQLPPGITLHAIERRFADAGREPIAAYAGALGRHRFEPGPSRPPGPAERRSLRRALGHGGPVRRWRAFRAVPPGGPAVTS